MNIKRNYTIYVADVKPEMIVEDDMKERHIIARVVSGSDVVLLITTESRVFTCSPNELITTYPEI